MSKIVRVEVGRFDYGLVGEFKFFRHGLRPSVLVRLTDDAGRQGWGQSVPVETWTYETVESVETTLRGYLGPAVLGADPADLADVHARMERAIRPSFSVGQPLAKAAIDIDLPRPRRLDKLPPRFNYYAGHIRDIFKSKGVLAMD